VLLSETGLLTPPVGLNLYVIQGIAKSPLADVVIGVVPYVFLLFGTLILKLSFPICRSGCPG